MLLRTVFIIPYHACAFKEDGSDVLAVFADWMYAGESAGSRGQGFHSFRLLACSAKSRAPVRALLSSGSADPQTTSRTC